MDVSFVGTEIVYRDEDGGINLINTSTNETFNLVSSFYYVSFCQLSVYIQYLTTIFRYLHPIQLIQLEICIPQMYIWNLKLFIILSYNLSIFSVNYKINKVPFCIRK